MDEIWVLGASGRAGRKIVAELAARKMPLVLLGRDASELGTLAKAVGGEARVVVARSVGEIASNLAGSSPTVVVNTIGPFTNTALPIARACAPGSHYLDIGNELSILLDLLAMHDEAVDTRRCIVPGAGWGVFATESVVLRLCEGRLPAARVRVDNLAYVDQTGTIGPTVAASVVESLAYGGRRYEGGALKRIRLGSDRERLTLPDGSTAETGSVPSGELEAACRASGASYAVAAFTEVPPPVVRAVLPALAALLSIPAVRTLATRQFARMATPPPKRSVSWAHARVEWQDGTTKEGWLRAGDAYAFLARTVAGLAVRLARGEGQPGAFTPGALFGPELAVEAGGEFVLGPA